MDKLRGWFILALLLLVGCKLTANPSPTANPTVELTITPQNSPVGLAVPTASITVEPIVTPQEMPVTPTPPAASPTIEPTMTPQNTPVIPTVTPAVSPIPPVWDLQIRITTTSDWTVVRLLRGVTIDNYKIVSANLSATVAGVDQDAFQLSQPLERANSAHSVEMVVDLSLNHTSGVVDLALEIDRGHIGETTVDIYRYICEQPRKVATLTWDGIQPSGANIKQFTIPYSQTIDVPKNEYIVIAQLNFWYYGPGPSGGFENELGGRNTALTPLLGWTYRASNPNVVEQQIEWALQYGVDAFSIEWTTPRGVGCCGSMEDTLDDVFLKSPNIGKIRWAIFYDFPLRLMQTPGLEKYAAGFDFDEPDVYNTFVYDFRRFAQKYFGNPQYLTIDGRPVIYIWATNAFRGNLEGALRAARQAVAEEGYDVFVVGDEVVAGEYDLHHASLFDGNTTFTFLIPGLPINTWDDIGDAIPDVDWTFERWRNNIKGLKVIDREETVNFQPAWAPQYDERSNFPNNPNATYVPATSKDQVIAMAEMARKHAEPVGSLGQKFIWVNTWNCWGETTTIEPTIDLGPKYPAGNYQFDMLEVVLEVFGAETYACGSP